MSANKNRILGAWEFFLYTVLFSIPVVGLICLIVFSLNNNNLCRRNFARSYWCVYLILLVVILVTIISGSMTALLSGLLNLLQK